VEKKDSGEEEASDQSMDKSYSVETVYASNMSKYQDGLGKYGS
jgi:hypothetical protein